MLDGAAAVLSVALPVVLVLGLIVSLFFLYSIVWPPIGDPGPPHRGLSMTAKGVPWYWKDSKRDPKLDLAIDFDAVEFPASDGRTLRGWFIPPPNGKTAAGRSSVCVVCCHGGARDRRGWLRHVPFFHEEGFGCLLFDYRGHGISDGWKLGCSQTIREHEDVMSAVQYALSQGYRGTILVGTSLGGASALMAAARLAAPDVLGVVAENPVASIPMLFDTVFYDLLPLRIVCRSNYPIYYALMPLWVVGSVVARQLIKIVWKYQGLDIDVSSSVEAIAQVLPRPVAVMHATGDQILPMAHGETVMEAARRAAETQEELPYPPIWLGIEGSEHCMLFDTHRESFCQVVRTVFHQSMSVLEKSVPSAVSPVSHRQTRATTSRQRPQTRATTSRS